MASGPPEWATRYHHLGPSIGLVCSKVERRTQALAKRTSIKPMNESKEPIRVCRSCRRWMHEPLKEESKLWMFCSHLCRSEWNERLEKGEKTD